MLFGGRVLFGAYHAATLFASWLPESPTFACPAPGRLQRASPAFGGVRADERRPARPLEPAISSRADL